MAPKKKSAPNGFMIFTFEWKAKHGKHLNIKDATDAAGKVWTKMSTQDREPYNIKAKDQKHNSNGSKQCREKLTCTGVPVKVVENEKIESEQYERRMKRKLENFVRNSVKSCELETQPYYFIMVNYFTKTLKGSVYVPAELSVCKFSLQAGVNKTYHTLINPGVTIYGHQYEAKHHSETTHKLPLPPHANGESNLSQIYMDVIKFIKDESNHEMPTIFTHRDSIPIVTSVLDFLKGDIDEHVEVYSIQYLFYLLKEATCDMGDLEKPKSFYITDAFFDRDFFEYQTGIACNYHETVDASKYCTQSCVVRWGFMFADYMCRDIAISLIPGRHIPNSTNLNAIVNPAPSEVSAYESCNDDQTETYPSTSNKFCKPDMKKKPSTTPSSQPYKKANNNAKPTNIDIPEMEPYDDDLNPWTSRSRTIPRAPDTSGFNINSTLGDHSMYEEFNASASAGRGRGRSMWS